MKKMKKTFVIILLLTGCIQMQGQERKPWVLRALNAVKTYIDSSAVKGIDTRYLEVPEKPWAVMLKSNANDMDLRSTTYMSEDQLAAHEVKGELNFETKLEPKREVSIGGWIGYRGYGLGYSYSLQRSKGRNFQIGATGANYGFNLRIRSFSTDEISYHYWGHSEVDQVDEEGNNVNTWDDIQVKSTIFDAFYFLNGKRFSYAAAYDQSMNQIRSAGSLMVGVKWFQTSVDYSKPLN
jgi:CubicO group peptidase (beta-lactamase class C family)